MSYEAVIIWIIIIYNSMGEKFRNFKNTPKFSWITYFLQQLLFVLF